LVRIQPGALIYEEIEHFKRIVAEEEAEVA
jgi:hypothetical protein